MIHQKICKDCGKVYDIEVCPFCREKIRKKKQKRRFQNAQTKL